jgi:hypothetical protein
MNLAILALLFANVSINSSIFNCFAHSFCTFKSKTIKPVLWDCWSKMGLYIFQLWKRALSTGDGQLGEWQTIRTRHVVANSGTDDMLWELIMNFSMSNTVFFVFSSSLLNSRLKDRTSVTRLCPRSDEYVCWSSLAANSISVSDNGCSDCG